MPPKQGKKGGRRPPPFDGPRGASPSPRTDRSTKSSRRPPWLVDLPTSASGGSQALPHRPADADSAPPTARGTPIILSAPVLLLTEARWEQIAPLLPPPKQQGRPAVDSYLLLAGILWIMRTAAPWRQMPEQFGPWQTAYTRYQDWQQSGLWTTILAILKADEPHAS